MFAAQMQHKDQLYRFIFTVSVTTADAAMAQRIRHEAVSAMASYTGDEQPDATIEVSALNPPHPLPPPPTK